MDQNNTPRDSPAATGRESASREDTTGLKGQSLEKGSDGNLSRCRLLAKPQKASRLISLATPGLFSVLSKGWIKDAWEALSAITAGPWAFSEQNAVQAPRPKGGRGAAPASLCRQEDA